MAGVLLHHRLVVWNDILYINSLVLLSQNQEEAEKMVCVGEAPRTPFDFSRKIRCWLLVQFQEICNHIRDLLLGQAVLRSKGGHEAGRVDPWRS